MSPSGKNPFTRLLPPDQRELIDRVARQLASRTHRVRVIRGERATPENGDKDIKPYLDQAERDAWKDQEREK